MRRRQRYQQLRAEGVLDRAPMTLVEEGRNPFPARRAPDRFRAMKENGYCPYCEKKVGTGIGLHMRHCAKNVEAAFDWKMKQRIRQIKRERQAEAALRSRKAAQRRILEEALARE